MALVDWKPPPTFLEKRSLLEIEQWEGEGRCQGQQSTEDPRARTALGLPRRGTSVTGGSCVPVKQEKLWGLQWCERNIHQNPRLWQGSLPTVPWWVPGEVHEVVWGQCQGRGGMSYKRLISALSPHSPSPGLPFPC